MSACPPRGAVMGGVIPPQRSDFRCADFPFAASSSCVWVNSGRAAFECILHSLPQRIGRVWLPRFICNTLLQPLERMRLPVRFYEVDAQMHPVPVPDIATDDVLVAVNYFGLTAEAVAQVVVQVPCTVVVDATTAFYAPPLPGVPCFYSPRKFAGMVDGGIAVAPFSLVEPAAQDAASDARCEALLQCCSDAAVQSAEDALSGAPLRMGEVSKELMLSIDWNAAAQQRLRNYAVLHRALAPLNRLQLPAEPVHAPMCYPFVSGIPGLRDYLIDAGVRLPLYWPEVIAATDASATENKLARTLLPLPIDQRYTEQDMEHLLSLVL